jgi:hypothetical protein
MGNRSFFFIGAPIAVLMAAAIAYVLVFWTPLFKRYGGSYPDYVAYDVYDYSYPADVRALAARQPEEVRAIVKELFDELKTKPEADLYILKSLPDVCAGEFECRGVPGKDVKPFVEAALSHIQARETAGLSAGSLETARLSLAIAVAAFIVSVFGLFAKRRA